MPDEIAEAKFRLERWCVMPGHGQGGREATLGLLCHRHAADVRDLLADVEELMIAYATGDAINAEKTEHKGGKNPHAPIPIQVNKFLIANPGRYSVPWTWARNGNPNTGRLESNGADAPDITEIIFHWADALTEGSDLDWPPGDTLAKLGFLRRHLDTVSELPGFYPDMIREFRNISRALALAIGEEPGPSAIGKCPNDSCNAPLLTDRDREVIRLRRMGETDTPPTGHADRIHCEACGAVWEGAGLIRLKLILEREAS